MSCPRIIIGITFLLPFATAVRAGPVTWEFAGEITSLVPEPGTLSLLALGALMIAKGRIP